MHVRQHRKAFAAFAGTAASAYIAAWAQTNGPLPGWLTAVACVLLGVVVGIIVAGVRDERGPIPEVAAHLTPIAEVYAQTQERLDAKRDADRWEPASW